MTHKSNVFGLDNFHFSVGYHERGWSHIPYLHDNIWTSEDLPDLDSNLRGSHCIFNTYFSRELLESIFATKNSYQLCRIYCVCGYKPFYLATNLSFIETIKKLSSINEKWPPARIFKYQIGYVTVFVIGGCISLTGLALSESKVVISYIYLAKLPRSISLRNFRFNSYDCACHCSYLNICSYSLD